MDELSDFPLNDFHLGDVLNFGRILANGEQTQVRICMHRKSKIFFCIKMEPFLSAEQKDILLRKSKMQNLSSHPLIVKLFLSFSDDKYLYHIMEYLPGGDLFEMVSTIGAVPEMMAKLYVSQIILAVEFLHNNHILHNDIKLENLILDNIDTVKLTDFGLATYEFEPPPTSINGTPGYMAPEIILRRNHGPEADWWSVGICIFELLTGTLPFDINDADSTLATFQKIIKSNLKLPRNLNPVATDLIKRLLTVDNQIRLGAGKNGTPSIKSHAWFSDVDWTSVHSQQVPGVHFVRNLHNLQ